MIKKVFALASVSALMGVVMAAGAAGCSSNETGVAPTENDAGVKDASGDRGVPKTGEEEEEEEEGCAAKKQVDAKSFPYTKAAKSPGACSNDELKALTKYYSENPQDPSIAEWSKTVSETCASCVFTAADGDAWGPLLIEGDKLTGANLGGCIELASEKEGCGRAYEQLIRCYTVACLPPSQGGSGTCATQAEFNLCRNDRDGLNAGACADAATTLQQECGSSFPSYEQACAPPAGAKYIFEVTVPAHCGGTGPDPDAGVDGA